MKTLDVQGFRWSGCPGSNRHGQLAGVIPVVGRGTGVVRTSPVGTHDLRFSSTGRRWARENPCCIRVFGGAGDRDRTGMVSLEG